MTAPIAEARNRGAWGEAGPIAVAIDLLARTRHFRLGVMFTTDELETAAQVVYRHSPATPQYDWPLLSRQVGAQIWVKHENHTATAAFKVRGGITFVDWLRRAHPEVDGIVTATRGNHGQSQARAAASAGLSATIYVPHGNSAEKNAAMRAFGADLIEFGHDFDAARTEAIRCAEAGRRFLVPPFHRELVRGVATYALELLTAVPELDTIYVPIGCGSGICGTIAARDALGSRAAVVGVVSTEAAGAKLSFDSGRLTATNAADTIADGMAVRVPVAEAFDIYRRGAERIVAVSDDEIRAAMRLLYATTHNVAEGAGAAALAAAVQERDRLRGRVVAVILSGGNVDTAAYAEILQAA